MFGILRRIAVRASTADGSRQFDYVDRFSQLSAVSEMIRGPPWQTLPWIRTRIEQPRPTILFSQW